MPDAHEHHRDVPPSRNFVDPLNPPLIVAMLRASSWIEESIRMMLEARGMPAATRQQALLLAQIACGERRAARIARKLGVSRQAISTLINELVDKGFITVERDPQDARAQLLDFSPEHAAQGKQHIELHRQLENHIGHLIGQDRMAVLRHALGMDWGEPSALMDTEPHPTDPAPPVQPET